MTRRRPEGSRMLSMRPASAHWYTVRRVTPMRSEASLTPTYSGCAEFTGAEGAGLARCRAIVALTKSAAFAMSTQEYPNERAADRAWLRSSRLSPRASSSSRTSRANERTSSSASVASAGGGSEGCSSRRPTITRSLQHHWCGVEGTRRGADLRCPLLRPSRRRETLDWWRLPRLVRRAANAPSGRSLIDGCG